MSASARLAHDADPGVIWSQFINYTPQVEVTLVFIMIAAGLVVAGVVAFGVAIQLRASDDAERPGGGRDRRQIAASILYLIARRGDADDRTAKALISEHLGAGPPSDNIDLTSWAGVYAKLAGVDERRLLLEQAVRLAMQQAEIIPLAQYNALMELSFGLGFQTDALARLRTQLGFEYVDYAKHQRPREADRSGGATSFFLRPGGEKQEFLNVFGLPSSATRGQVIAAYRKMAAQQHPDKFHNSDSAAQLGAAEEFKRLTGAYERLLTLLDE